MKNVILGSQSPQRFRLLQSVVPDNQLSVLPPADDSELGFDDCQTPQAIEERLTAIVAAKLRDVCQQVATRRGDQAEACVVCADTIVVANDEFGQSLVLGKPPADNWQPIVRDWFANFYSDRRHDVWTCFGLSVDGRTEFQIVKTTVAFPKIDDWWIDWYLSTEEPLGKAGGYGIQGHAAALVESISGSLTNVIGLPMFELANALRRLDVISDAGSQS